LDLEAPASAGRGIVWHEVTELVVSCGARLTTRQRFAVLSKGSAAAVNKEKGMFDTDDKSTRRSLGTIAAIMVVVLAGLILDLGHLGVVPPGIVEVGELMPLEM